MSFWKKVQETVNHTVEAVGQASVESVQGIVEQGVKEIEKITVDDIPEAPSSVSIGSTEITIPPIPTVADVAENVQDQLSTAVKDKIITVATNAIENLKSSIPDPSDLTQKMVDEITSYKDQLENLLQQLDPAVLINKALDNGEVVCEEYINSKMAQVVSSLPLQGVSDVEFTLNGTKINAGLTLYLTLADFEGNFSNSYIVNLTSNVEVNIVNPVLPNPFPEPAINKGNLYEEMKNTIEKEKQKILEGVSKAIIDSYFPVFTVVDKFKGLLQI